MPLGRRQTSQEEFAWQSSLYNWSNQLHYVVLFIPFVQIISCGHLWPIMFLVSRWYTSISDGLVFFSRFESMSSFLRCAPVMFWECSFDGRGLQLQLQSDLRTPCSWTLLRSSSCKREEAELQQGTAAGSPCTWLLQPPAILAEGWGGVQPGQTRCTTTGRQYSEPTFAVSAKASQGLKVLKSFSVWSRGCCRVRVTAGRGGFQAVRRRRPYISAAFLDLLLWIGDSRWEPGDNISHFWLGNMNDTRSVGALSLRPSEPLDFVLHTLWALSATKN